MQPALLVCLLVLAPAARASVVQGSPVAKVVSLLSSLEAKIIAEGAAAQKTYAEFSEWCEDRSKNLGFEIKTLSSEKEGLVATIADETATADAMRAKIEELAGEISKDEADLTAATGIRATEKADFLAEEAELSETISAIERAITILEREMSKSPSLMQLKTAGNLAQVFQVLVKGAFISTADASKLTSFVQAEDTEAGAPAAAAYESSSGGVVQVLQDLLSQAKDQLNDARNKELEAKNAYELLAQNLEDEIKYAEKELDESKANLESAKQAIAVAKGDLGVTTRSLAAATGAKATLHQDCMEKAQDFELETKSRGEELKALATAKKVISESTGGADGIAYGLNQVGVSLLQLDRQHLNSGKDLADFEALRFVRDLARKTQSTALTQLASRMAAAMRYGSGSGDDQFAKVKGLIRDLIERLLAEAAAEAAEKAYCDKELAETHQKKEDKEDEVQKLTVAIDQMTARIATLKTEITALAKSLAELAATQMTMDKIRMEEHELYVKQKGEMEDGLQGIKMALKLLKGYYGGEADHEAATGAGEGIIGLIEVIESDFTKELIEINASERTSAAEYDSQTKENQIMKATWDQDVNYKSKEKKELEQALAEATSDRSAVQAELAAVLEYLKRLEDRCLAKPMTYEERVRRREAEIAGLKEALEILNGEDVLAENEKRSSEAFVERTSRRSLLVR